MQPKDLIKHSIEAQKRAKAPYSNYKVGAALLTKTGEIILGCNVESKAYPTTMCAERVAIFSALAQGHSQFNALAIVTEDGGSPCGSCRQIIFEYAPNAEIYVSDNNGNYKTYTIHDLLPHPF
ncbi:cytidine deaminase [Candidatus Woesearchaeota archaeon]|nr:cytidine deaminase [Candidatus Woesearchaeota archaeon]